MKLVEEENFGLVISALTSSKFKHNMINNETNSYLTKYNVFNMVTIRYWQLIISGAFLLTIISHPMENSPYAISANWFSHNSNVLIAWYVIRRKDRTSRKSSIYKIKVPYKYNYCSWGSYNSFLLWKMCEKKCWETIIKMIAYNIIQCTLKCVD
jgi:hypothetical protein